MDLTTKSFTQPCLFNLIAYTHDLDNLKELQTFLDLVRDKFPCRLILIGENRKDTNETVKVENDQNNQLSIMSGTAELSKMPFIILPYLISDLPIYLFLKEDPTDDNPVKRFLKSIATRLIFDCKLPENLADWSGAILRLLEQPTINIIDMNWVRLLGWRTIFVQVFDSKERLESLKDCSSLTIFYNKFPGDQEDHLDEPAIYLQAWLSSRLGWKFKKAKRENGCLSFVYETSGKDISVDLKPIERSGLPAGELTKIDVHCGNESSFLITRSNLSQVEVHIETQDRCYIPFKLPLPSICKKQQFIKELLYTEPSDHYPALLRGLSNYGKL